MRNADIQRVAEVATEQMLVYISINKSKMQALFNDIL